MELHELVNEWIKYSKNDLSVAQYLYYNMHPRQLEIICYHSQQSAEKALKAFLVLNDITPPKIHDLNRLCEMCNDLDGTFSQITQNCSALNLYSNLPRYPFEIEILDSDAESAIYKADEVQKFVENLVLAWDPDFTKVTPEEAKRIAAAEESGFISEDEIDWDNIGQ